MAITGGAVTTLASGQTGIYAVATDATAVYFCLNQGAGVIKKVAK